MDPRQPAATAATMNDIVVRDDGNRLLQLLMADERLSNVEIDAPVKGDRLIHVACRLGSILCVNHLLRYGALLNIKNSDGVNPLDIVKIKLSHHQNNQHRYHKIHRLFEIHALQYAASGDVANFTRVMDSGLEMNFQSKNDGTLLHWCSLVAKEVDVIRVILQRGGNIHARNAFGDTPLHEACRGGNICVMECLIQHGADPKARNKAGKTPLQVYEDTHLPLANSSAATAKSSHSQPGLGNVALTQSKRFPQTIQTLNGSAMTAAQPNADQSTSRSVEERLEKARSEMIVLKNVLDALTTNEGLESFVNEHQDIIKLQQEKQRIVTVHRDHFQRLFFARGDDLMQGLSEHASLRSKLLDVYAEASDIRNVSLLRSAPKPMESVVAANTNLQESIQTMKQERDTLRMRVESEKEQYFQELLMHAQYAETLRTSIQLARAKLEQG